MLNKTSHHWLNPWKCVTLTLKTVNPWLRGKETWHAHYVLVVEYGMFLSRLIQTQPNPPQEEGVYYCVSVLCVVGWQESVLQFHQSPQHYHPAQ